MPLPIRLRASSVFASYHAGPNVAVVAALKDAANAATPALFLSGAAGTGKTHLLQALCARAQPVVLAGDYNVVPTNEKADIYSAKSWLNDALLQPETRDAYRRLLAQGWSDAIQQLHHGEPMYTFWDYMRNRWPRDAGLRLDHLLISPALAPRLQKAGVDRKVRGEDGASDHAPAWVVLK